jgi:hypothetical protein
MPIPAVVAADYYAVPSLEDLSMVKAVATMARDADSALVTNLAESGMFHLYCGLGIWGQRLLRLALSRRATRPSIIAVTRMGHGR